MGAGLTGCKSNDWQTISKFPANPTSYEDDDDDDDDENDDDDDNDVDDADADEKGTTIVCIFKIYLYTYV